MTNRRFATALASALADLGVEHAVVSPGSRNTPLLAGFGAEERIRKWPIIDERSAGFFALGLARATGKPVVLACTSGTAAVEYHPAIVEAGLSDIPLLVLTADRPEELRNVGAPQTIDQISLYGSAVRMFADALAPDETTSDETPGEIAIDIWAHATATPPGPVHLNLPFREPLLEKEDDFSPPRVIPPRGSDEEIPDLATIAERISGKRGVIVSGRSNDPHFPTACSQLAAATGFPVMADPLSGLRFGNHDLSNVLAYADQLAAAGALDIQPPEVVVRFGPVPTSKPIWGWLEHHPDVDQILVDVQSRDATRSARTTLELDPTEAAVAMAAGVTERATSAWLHSWVEMDEKAADALREIGYPSEPAVARILAQSVPDGTALTVGSSMPIRDVDAYGGKAARSVQVYGNRGANGIDGIVSSAMGVAASGANSVVLLGDISLFHDINALGTATQLGLPITVVVIDNDGGGIFHFLPHQDPEILDPKIFEQLLVTPHGSDFGSIAAAFGLDTYSADNADDLRGLVAVSPGRPRLIEVKTDRGENLLLHRTLTERVRRAIR